MPRCSRCTSPRCGRRRGPVHATWLAAVHAPDWHVSLKSQALPSLHDVPFATLVYAVALTLGWHVSHVLAPFAAPEATHAPPTKQNPGSNVAAEHCPVVGLHVPAVWHESGAVHVT